MYQTFEFSIFRPAGWDNDNKIKILHENLNSMKPEDSYEDVIAKPVSTRKVGHVITKHVSMRKVGHVMCHVII